MTAARDQAVVCVHGLWLSGFATGFWRRSFAAAGYAAHSFSYPSVRQPLAASARQLAEFAAALPERRISFAGHSLGAVLIVAMLAERGWRLPDKELGSIVLAGPPFQDSGVGRHLARLPIGRMMVGRAVEEWLAGPRPVVPAHVQLGVIAGTRPIGAGRLAMPSLAPPHDGTVRVAETRVEGAREHISMAVSHTEMLMSARVTRQMLHFFARGAFGK